MYTGAGDIDSFGRNCGMTYGVLPELEPENYYCCNCKSTAMMEPITIPAIAPIGRALLFPFTEGQIGVGVVKMRPPSRVGITKPKVVSILLRVMVDIRPFKPSDG